jgi:hypothetical protein
LKNIRFIAESETNNHEITIYWTFKIFIELSDLEVNFGLQSGKIVFGSASKNLVKN